MNPSDSIRQQAEAAEQRGLEFFHKLSKQSPGNSSFLEAQQSRDEEESLSIDMNVDSRALNTSSMSLPGSAARQGSRQKMQTRFASSSLASTSSQHSSSSMLRNTSHLSSNRKDSYTNLTSPCAQTGTGSGRDESVTINFSFFTGIKIPALSMTMNAGLGVGQVKTMVCKKISAHKVLLPSDLLLMFNGRELKDSVSLAEIPVTNGSYLKVYICADGQQEDRGGEDSFLVDHQVPTAGSPFFQTPQAKGKGGVGGSGITPGYPQPGHLSSGGVPSSIKYKQSPYSFVSSPPSPHPNELSGLSFRATGVGMATPSTTGKNTDPDHMMRGLQRGNISMMTTPGGGRGRLTSTQKTTSGGAVMSEEAAFYEILEDVLELQQPEGVEAGEELEAGRLGAVALESVEHQSHLAEAYAREVADRYEATVSQLNLSLHPHAHAHMAVHTNTHTLKRDLEDLRAERDLWSLASRLLVQDLLKDVQDAPNDQALRSLLATVPPSHSLKEVITRCIATDERIKKGRVLKDWLESCSRDQIHEPPEPPSMGDGDSSFPWKETLNRLKRTHPDASGNQKQSQQQRPRHSSSSPTGVTHIHPDSQLGPKGQLILLDGNDHTDQETLLKVVWQHIRGGQLVQAQSLAHRHKVHWLSAALMGVAEEFYAFSADQQDQQEQEDEDEELEEAGVTRRGNKNRPLWMQVCWRYASALNSNAANKTTVPGQSQQVAVAVAMLEASIYAALSTNYTTLKDSVLLQTYADHLWAKVRCAHERQIAHVSSQFRLKRRESSSLYPGTSDKVVAAESKYLKDTVQLQSAFCGNSADLFKDIISHNKSSHSTVSGLILQLQAALIQGRTAISAFIQNDIRAFAVQTKARRTKFPDEHSEGSVEQCRVLRVFVHFLLWLRYSCQQHDDLQALVPDGVLHVVLEAYIACLAQRQQYSLVALYCSYLSRPKRLGTYMALLRVISPTSVRSEEGHIVPAASLHMGATATLASTLTLSRGRGGGGTCCMSLSGRNTGMRGVDDDATAQEVLTLAKKFFDEKDVVEITNAVVDLARKGMELGGKGGASSLGATSRDFADTFQHSRGGPLSGGGKTGGASFFASQSQIQTQSFAHTATSVAATTVVPGSYDEGDIPAEDAERMESLRWLCYYEEQSADAAKEANAFLRAFMLESSGAKTLQVRVLLTNILPSNFIMAGTESLQLKIDRLDLEDASSALARKQLEDNWDAEVGQLELWKYTDWSIYCFEQFEKEVHDFEAKQADYVGDAHAVATSLYGLKHQLLRSADRCLKSIRKALGCGARGVEVDTTQGCMYFEDSSDQHDFDDRGGFLAIWCTSVDTSVASLLQLLVRHLSEQEIVGRKDERGDNKEAHQDPGFGEEGQLMRECFQELERLERSPVALASPHELEQGSTAASLFAPPAGLDLVREHLEAIRDQAGAGAVSFDTCCVLQKAQDLLRSVLETREAMQLVAYLLLRNYLAVCGRTAGVLEALQASPQEVLQWQQQAADVAVLMADEAENMQLYKALRLGDLQKLLAGVSVANTHILRIQKAFDIFSE